MESGISLPNPMLSSTPQELQQQVNELTEQVQDAQRQIEEYQRRLRQLATERGDA